MERAMSLLDEEQDGIIEVPAHAGTIIFIYLRNFCSCLHQRFGFEPSRPLYLIQFTFPFDPLPTLPS